MHRPSAYTLLAITHDLVAAALAWSCAYLLRFNFDLPPSFQEEMLGTLLWVAPLQSLIFWRMGLYRGIWRYASMADLRRIFLAVMLAAIMIPLVLWMFRVDAVVPRSVLILDPILLLLAMGGDRLLYRLWKERGLLGDFSLRGEPVLVLGAGGAGVSLSKDLLRSREWHQVGFLDDDRDKQGCLLNGIKVLGTLDSLPYWSQRLGVSQVIIAMPSASHQVRKRVIDLANRNAIKALTVPTFDDLLSGRVSVSQLRAVELDDLLGRDAVHLDTGGLQDLLAGKTVMVTGAGGSIGAELCRQIARFSPAKLVLYELGELALYNMEQELGASFPDLSIEYLVGDVRDEARLDQVFAEYHPNVVFHAAAYKHVPLMECGNAWQAVRNNVYGTWQVARCAQKYGAGTFVLISTDKAVNPTNVMGASKRLAEIVCTGLQQEAGTRFVTVRFGNVLGSNGSVIPKFREQIAKGGPVTVTHPDITRYFMSIPEAAQLVMQAGCMGQGGEIFVLEMGEPVKIVDLAKDMIRLSGLDPEEVMIEFTGLRPGEKLYEELLADSEQTLPTPHPKLRIAKARRVSDGEMRTIESWSSATITMSDEQVREAMRQWMPEYKPNPNGFA
ncbi:MAG: polysaccharide biosynthesis protein [Gammaproteobacteria bacterium]|nr:polysaccharide biosynthesis protein [Gammaproteobacteria bacterium]MBU1624046.1 polysaccharide biosynthesis protein [Gammaproteobacteria bacterium]MBU1981774.1 polysaccharide biosynthesis protein [Gammaproteobacteria bacterium]